MKQKLAYYSISVFLFFGKILPKRWIYSFSKRLLGRYYRMKPKRVEIMHANIKRAFPEMSDSRIKEFGMGVYDELAKTISEAVLANANRIKMQNLVVNSDEALSRLKLINSGNKRGIIFITAHYGNWELLCHWLAVNGFPLLGITKSSKNSLIENRILKPFRSRYGNRSIPHNNSMLSIAKALNRGENVMMAIDQVVQPPNGVPVNFFGHKTAATKSAAVLKVKYNPLIVPVFIERVGFEKLEIKVGDPIEPAPEIYTDKQKQIEDMIQSYYNAIEKQIRNRPEQWLWMYNRWKSIRDV